LTRDGHYPASGHLQDISRLPKLANIEPPIIRLQMRYAEQYFSSSTGHGDASAQGSQELHAPRGSTQSSTSKDDTGIVRASSAADGPSDFYHGDVTKTPDGRLTDSKPTATTSTLPSANGTGLPTLSSASVEVGSLNKNTSTSTSLPNTIHNSGVKSTTRSQVNLAPSTRESPITGDGFDLPRPNLTGDQYLADRAQAIVDALSRTGCCSCPARSSIPSHPLGPNQSGVVKQALKTVVDAQQLLNRITLKQQEAVSRLVWRLDGLKELARLSAESGSIPFSHVDR